MRRIWLLAFAATLLTTACRIETNILIDLNADRTGSFGFEFGMDDEFRQLIAAQGETFDVADIFGDLGGELPGAAVSERTEGDMMFSVVTVAFDGEGEFQQLIAQGAGEGGDIDVTWDDDRVSIVAVLEGTGDDGGLGPLGALGDLGDAAGDLGGEFDLGGDFDIGGISSFADSFFSGSVIVRMPGEVDEHNADGVLPDGRLQWDLALDGSDIEIRAVSDLGGGSGFPAWALVLLVLAAAATLLWLLSVQRSRRAAAAVEAAGLGSAGSSTVPTDWSTPSSQESEESPPIADEEPPS